MTLTEKTGAALKTVPEFCEFQELQVVSVQWSVLNAESARDCVRCRHADLHRELITEHLERLDFRS